MADICFGLPTTNETGSWGSAPAPLLGTEASEIVSYQTKPVNTHGKLNVWETGCHHSCGSFTGGWGLAGIEN